MAPPNSGSNSHPKIVRANVANVGPLHRATEWAWMAASGLALALFFLAGLLIGT